MFYVSNYHNFNAKQTQTLYNSAYYTLFTSIRKQANLQAGTYNSAIFCIIKTMVQNTDRCQESIRLQQKSKQMTLF